MPSGTKSESVRGELSQKNSASGNVSQGYGERGLRISAKLKIGIQ